MNALTKFTTTMSATFSKVKFQINKHSPEILMVSGIVGLVGAAVWACKATLNSKEIIDSYNWDKNDIEATIRKDGTTEVYTEEEKKSDMTKLKVKTAISIAKEYAPSVSITIVSITAIIVSHNIMRKRALALAAAYATVDSAFKRYRDQVIERYGEEVDKEIRYGVSHKTTQQEITDDKGKKKVKDVETTEVSVTPDEYTRIFENGNKYHDANNDYIRHFLDSEESRINNLLRANHHVFLNDVFDRLGFEKTKVGQVVGWTYTPDKDCYIDFGIYMMEDEHKAILKFNPQGYILDKLEEGI